MKVYLVSPSENFANCYVLVDEKSKQAAVVDCGACTEELITLLNSDEISELKYILLTHGHYDHILGVSDLKEKSNAAIAIHSQDADCLLNEGFSLANRVYPNAQKPITADLLLEDGMVLTLGDLEIKVIHTPGHTKGGVCYLCEDVIFTGDSLFYRTIGRTDLPGGNYATLIESVNKLAKLKGDFTIYPGHDRATTLHAEKTFNIYLREI